MECSIGTVSSILSSEAIPLDANAFDIVYSISVLEHIMERPKSFGNWPEYFVPG